jgi:hypothetical protein
LDHLKEIVVIVTKFELPPPKAHKIIPEIVASWNYSKGSDDE